MQITNPMKSKISTNLSMAARQMHSILVTILFIVSMVWVPFGTVHADGVSDVTSSSVKWHPGHYYSIMSGKKNNPAYLTQVYSELDDTPALRGVQIRYSWTELETSYGVYDFSSIDNRLAELAAKNKRLIILLNLRIFDPDTALVPNYLENDSIYEGGIFPYASGSSSTIKGYNIKLWNPMVRDRLAALFSALGKRFNSHNYFEGIGLTETAIGVPIKPLTSVQVNGYYSNLLVLNQNMQDSFRNTMTYQYANYSRSILPSLIDGLKAMGAALGCPDVFIEEPGLHFSGTPKGVYKYYPENSGLMPLTVQVGGSNYENTRYDGTGYQPTVSELLAFAKSNLKVNYIFWQRDPDYYPKVLEMLNWSGQKSNPSGGLDPTCPMNYTSCVN
ncbi:MAG TPA: glycoside hydrolase [Gammaproteobacteria bacterium]|nr:glycoside hydrolase [Gammaproteobacteria bacterium]